MHPTTISSARALFLCMCREAHAWRVIQGGEKVFSESVASISVAGSESFFVVWDDRRRLRVGEPLLSQQPNKTSALRLPLPHISGGNNVIIIQQILFPALRFLLAKKSPRAEGEVPILRF
jgi:hypothetical protein